MVLESKMNPRTIFRVGALQPLELMMKGVFRVPLDPIAGRVALHSLTAVRQSSWNFLLVSDCGIWERTRGRMYSHGYIKDNHRSATTRTCYCATLAPSHILFRVENIIDLVVRWMQTPQPQGRASFISPPLPHIWASRSDHLRYNSEPCTDRLSYFCMAYMNTHAWRFLGYIPSS